MLFGLIIIESESIRTAVTVCYLQRKMAYLWGKEYSQTIADGCLLHCQGHIEAY